MRYKVDRHPLVRRDLMEITRLVGEYAGYDVSRRKMAEFRQTISQFEDFPHIGTLRHDIRPNLRAIPAAGKGVICFTVDDERRTVLIIAITYAGADWSSRVAERD
ncbi:type II toxin-antitoxin system RelE/ParE family toxin [Ciceribacter selenitireducens]|nr:type II toxin-antitoxin system RelE/ParE family toxin [Ciceribacter selenitireducens]